MLDNENGMTIVWVFGIMVIIGILAFALVFRTVGERQITSYLMRSEMAFNAAEACLDIAIEKLSPTPFPVIEPIPAPPDTWVVMPNNALYKTGLPDSLAEEVLIKEVTSKEFEDTKLQYIVYRARTSGKSRTATRSIEAEIRMGPLGEAATTQYK